MNEVVLDGSTWQTRDDVYDAFFAAVGAPSWHGRNLDALNDSIATGQINKIEVPYRLIIRHYNLIGEGAMKMASDFVDLIRDIRASGCPVEIVLEK
jgi:RNAse (barnase) inhibitor barstar